VTWQGGAFDRWYFRRSDWKSGSSEFRDWIAETSASSRDCLELGPGPANQTSEFLSRNFAAVDGLDVDESIQRNRFLRRSHVYDGHRFPFESASYSYCVADFVLEHVEYPQETLSEIARVLRRGGRFYFRTPNLYHYVALASRVLPHCCHEALANRLRQLPPEAPAPFRTYYRCNTRRRIKRLAALTGLHVVELRMVEKEPSYGKASRFLFYPFLAYERLVNFSELLAGLRANIFGMLERP
jgi:SAM-dependent methyltransferase